MDIIENDLDEIASLLKKQKAHHTLKSLMTVCLNLIEHPKDERMRTLRTTNPTVARTLLAFPEAMIFLKKLGFIEVDGFLSLIGNDVSLFQIAASVLSRYNNKETNEINQSNSKSQTSKSSVDKNSNSSSNKETNDLKISNNCQSRFCRPPNGFQRLVSPTKTWQDIIELKLVKNQLQSSPPFGECVLLYGAPGSGKSSVAHAAAEAWGLRVFTIFGSEIQTPFAKSRHSILKHFLRHAFEVGPCLILLRGMDSILAEVVEEVRNEFASSVGTAASSTKVVVMATCNSTNELMKSSLSPHFSLPRRISKSELKNRPFHPPIVTNDEAETSCSSSSPSSVASSSSTTTSLMKDHLSCFDMLIHIPTLSKPSSISLLLQSMIEEKGAILPTSISRIVCTIIGSHSSNGEISGHILRKVAQSAIDLALSQQESTNPPHGKGHNKVVVTADNLRTAFDNVKP